MKTKLLTLLIILTANLSFSQVSENLLNKTKQATTGEHEHDGFYLSMGLGFAGGTITDVMTMPSTDTYDFSGAASIVDAKIGGAISPDLILHATFLSTALVGPSVKSKNQGSTKASDDLTIGEMMIGLGLTRYFMPSNIFLSGSIGLGHFSVINGSKSSINTQSGFSYQIKAGKEWWVSPNWGLGLALSLGSTFLTYKPTGNVEEKFSSLRFGLMFNATFN